MQSAVKAMRGRPFPRMRAIIFRRSTSRPRVLPHSPLSSSFSAVMASVASENFFFRPPTFVCDTSVSAAVRDGRTGLRQRLLSSPLSSSSLQVLFASQRTFFSSSSSSFSSHARSLPSDPYRNRFTAFFFKELNKGFLSPWVLLAFGIFSSAVLFKWVEWWSAPERERQRQLTPRVRVPMKAGHEAVWGFGVVRGAAGEGGEASSSLSSSSSPFSAPSSPPATPGAAIFDPAVAVAESEALLQRPRLIHTELQHASSSPLSFSSSSAPLSPTEHAVEGRTNRGGRGGADEVVIMEVPEYDATIKDDTYVRSLHYIPLSSDSASPTTPFGEGNEMAPTESARGGGLFRFFPTRSVKQAAPAHPKSTTTTTAEGGGKGGSMDQYFRFMPGGGNDHIHGMVKCKRGEDHDGVGGNANENWIDRRGDEERQEAEKRGGSPLSPRSSGRRDTALPCVPYAGDLSRESGRKLLLTLGPLHILQDPNQGILPFRFSMVKHPEIRVLVIGLREGGVPRWLSTAYPFFTIDVVDPDLSLIRLVKDFFGFQTHSRLRVVPTTPTRFLVEKVSSVETGHTAAESSVTLRSLFIPWKKGPVTRKSVSEQFHSSSSSSSGDDGALSPMEDPRPYDLILIDAIDPHGNLPSYVGRLEFVQQIRQVLSPTGVVGVLLPNHQPQPLYHTIQHWRMGFQGRSLLLAHCRQEPMTMMMTFQDEGGRGQPTIGTLRSAEELRDVLRSHLTHYGIERVPLFDLTEEVESGVGKERRVSNHNSSSSDEEKKKEMVKKKGLPYASLTLEEKSDFFKIVAPERRYEPEDYLPGGHPYVLAQRRHRPQTTLSSSVLSRGSQEETKPFPFLASTRPSAPDDEKKNMKETENKRKWWRWWKSA